MPRSWRSIDARLAPRRSGTSFGVSVVAGSGTCFPVEISGGNCIPELQFRTGCGFRLSSSAESASRNLGLEWDALSGWGLMRKAHPTLEVHSGTGFPVGLQAESVSHSERLFWAGLSARGLERKVRPSFGWKARHASLCFQMNTLWAKRDDSPRKHSSMLKYPEDRRSYVGLLFYTKHSMRRLTR